MERTIEVGHVSLAINADFESFIRTLLALTAVYEWLDTARTLAATGHSGVLLALAIAWLAAFATAIQQLREGFGIPAHGQPPERPTPWVARGALWIAGLGLIAMGVAWSGRGGAG